MTDHLRIACLLACALSCCSLRAEDTPAISVPMIDLGFPVQQMQFDATGKTALVWGGKVADRRRHLPNTANEETTFALVDLDRLKVLATQSEAANIQLACLDDKYIYLIPANDNVLYRLDRTDISKRTRLVLAEKPSRVEALPDGHVAIMLTNTGQSNQPFHKSTLPDGRVVVASSNQPDSSVVVYDRETLTRSPGHFGEMDPSVVIREGSPIAERGMDGTLVFRDKVVEAATREFRCALENNLLPAMVDSAAAKNAAPGGSQVLWARTVSRNAITNARALRLSFWWSLTPSFRLSIRWLHLCDTSRPIAQ